MKIVGSHTETFLLLNGLKVDHPIRLSDHAQFLPATFVPTPGLLSRVLSKEPDFSIASLFLGTVASQIKVSAPTPKELAVLAWNTYWDILLINAFLQCESICNLQSDVPLEELCTAGVEGQLQITNYHLRGPAFTEPRMVADAEAEWIEANVERGRQLLQKPSFQNAVHSLATYSWHSLPRAQLALIWSGIEGLFEVESEIVFRVSLYIARFLHPDDAEQRLKTFADVKRLYKARSQAVHGSRLKGDSNAAVSESSSLLSWLIRKCCEAGALPVTANLAP